MSAQGDILAHKAFKQPKNISPGQMTEGISDITFWLNGREAGMFTTHEYSRGTYRDKTINKLDRGKYTPKWWRGSYYGQIVTINITNKGTFINNAMSSNLTIADYKLFGSYVDFRVGIKNTAKHISGFNIYGTNFGNFPQDLILRLYESPVE